MATAILKRKNGWHLRILQRISLQLQSMQKQQSIWRAQTKLDQQRKRNEKIFFFNLPILHGRMLFFLRAADRKQFVDHKKNKNFYQ